MHSLHLFFLTIIIISSSICSTVLAQDKQVSKDAATTIVKVKRTSVTCVELILNQKRKIIVDFYGDNIFRLFRNDQSKKMHPPTAKQPARILVANSRQKLQSLTVQETAKKVILTTKKLQLQFNKKNTLLTVIRRRDKQVIMQQSAPLVVTKKETLLTLKEFPQEYFFGGGVQNGRFSHKGKTVAIVNENSWVDGGVASPAPYFWSTRGYGIMWYTFKAGQYAFGSKQKNTVLLSHKTHYLDIFVMAGATPTEQLKCYYQLTGNPVLLPKFGLYLGHLNAYNRDYWVKSEDSEKGILFEDGNRYLEKRKNEKNQGILETLNGEKKGSYQFSARAVIDRYLKADMPLGWLLPNDGYGAGYGQTGTLKGNIANLRKLSNYAHKQGVEIGLWTESELSPKKGVAALLQRDLIAEVRDAGVRVLKTDVAWVGHGYSFGLHGIANAAKIITSYGDNARPFIITLDGWAGTQRYGSIWTGDQSGGNWEYIRFHIPTYLGAGLSGLSNIGSDMDGIFGGNQPIINTRDYQWKTFTALQLNMDGWGENPKYPQALGEPCTAINRFYLKLKSTFMPYLYSLAYQSTTGLPMVRAMFLAEANPYTLGTASRYQFLCGPSLLVAPIYQATRSDKQGNDIRNNIYLPQGQWVDYFTGNVYTGNRIINEFASPLWKLPLFVRRGAILPKNLPHNTPNQVDKNSRIYEIYPYAKSTFTAYDDDGKTIFYKDKKYTTTTIQSNLKNQLATIQILPSKGSFRGFQKMKTTTLQINISRPPKTIQAKINGKNITLNKVNSLRELTNVSHGYYYEATPSFNQFTSADNAFSKNDIIKNPILHIKIDKIDTTKNKIAVTIDGYYFDTKSALLTKKSNLRKPQVISKQKTTTPYSITPHWQQVAGADYYEIEFNNMLYSTIQSNYFQFNDLKPNTAYQLRVRAVNLNGYSAWQHIKIHTKKNPYRWTLSNIKASCTAPDQPHAEITKLFDRNLKSSWHTKWATPIPSFEITIDLAGVNTLEKVQYWPRISGTNGIITKGSLAYSLNKKTWHPITDFSWQLNNKPKTILFKKPIKAAYLRWSITKASGDYGSGREFFIFKKPHSASYLFGDINDDKKIDNNDLTSYKNYMGLRQGDPDFDGYIVKGDVNRNGLIDALDVSYVATKLAGGIPKKKATKLTGHIILQPNKRRYRAGETIKIAVLAKNFTAVNALSFALPYNHKLMQFSKISNKNVVNMADLTIRRSHANGQQALYPTFINIGNDKKIVGNQTLFVIEFIAKKDVVVAIKVQDGLLVDDQLNVIALPK